MASAGVLVFVLFVFRLPAVLVPGRDRLRQARHLLLLLRLLLRLLVLLWRRRLTRERPAFFLFGRALHPHAPPPAGGVTGCRNPDGAPVPRC